MHSTFVVLVLCDGHEFYKILYLFYGPVSLSHLWHFNMFTAESPKKLKIAKHAADFSFNAGSIFFSLQFIF